MSGWEHTPWLGYDLKLMALDEISFFAERPPVLRILGQRWYMPGRVVQQTLFYNGAMHDYGTQGVLVDGKPIEAGQILRAGQKVFFGGFDPEECLCHAHERAAVRAREWLLDGGADSSHTLVLGPLLPTHCPAA